MKEIIKSFENLPDSSSVGFLIFGIMLILFHKQFGRGVAKSRFNMGRGLTERRLQTFYLVMGIILMVFGALIIII